MAPSTWALQIVLLSLAASSFAQNFPSQGFDDFDDSQQFQQQQPPFQRSQFAPLHGFDEPIKRPLNSRKFIDPQSVRITPASSKGFQNHNGRFSQSQQFSQQAARTPPAKQYHFDTQFVEPSPGQVVQPVQDTFQQAPVQTFQPAPAQSFEQAPPAQVPIRTQPEPTRVSPARRPHVKPDTFNEDIAREQAQNAKYSFQAAVTDTISDNQNVREEVRDGLALKGLYSYSDGYFKRTVHYEADENGYRVVKEDVEPIGNGPQEDPNGRADIQSNVGGAALAYTITGDDINRRQQQQQLLRTRFQQQQTPQV